MDAVVRDLLPSEVEFFQEHGWAFLPGSRDRNRSAATMIFEDHDDV